MDGVSIELLARKSKCLTSIAKTTHDQSFYDKPGTYIVARDFVKNLAHRKQHVTRQSEPMCIFNLFLPL